MTDADLSGRILDTAGGRFDERVSLASMRLVARAITTSVADWRGHESA